MAQMPRQINHTQMHQLLANSMVVDLCNTCLKGKQHHKKFPKEVGTRITNILGLIYYDICDPIEHQHILAVLISLHSLMITQDTQQLIFYIISCKFQTIC
jgi:hypothetical protein